MIKTNDLKKIAQARLRDAEILNKSKRHEGAIYLCGYVIELGLKARICKTLKWLEFPSSAKEFQNYKSFKTHDLDVLLHLSGVEERIKTKLLSEWSAVAAWDPAVRYNPASKASEGAAKNMVSSAKKLLAAL